MKWSYRIHSPGIIICSIHKTRIHLFRSVSTQDPPWIHPRIHPSPSLSLLRLRVLSASFSLTPHGARTKRYLIFQATTFFLFEKFGALIYIYTFYVSVHWQIDCASCLGRRWDVLGGFLKDVGSCPERRWDVLGGFLKDVDLYFKERKSFFF